MRERSPASFFVWQRGDADETEHKKKKKSSKSNHRKRHARKHTDTIHTRKTHAYIATKLNGRVSVRERANERERQAHKQKRHFNASVGKRHTKYIVPMRLLLLL